MVLIVEDESISAVIAMSALSDSLLTHHVASGQEALDYCLVTLPDIILMDINMKGLDGLQTCVELKNDKRTRHIPIIFSTSDVDAETEDKCWDVGAADFVCKPYSIKTLRNRVNSHLSVKLLTDKLTHLATIDGLTNIQNRRYLDFHLEEQLKLAIRNKTSLGFLLIDIDYFKKFNDRYGHLRGDEVLRRVAKSLKNSLRRPSDSVARFGGEEFAVVLPDTDQAGLLHVANNIIQSIKKLAEPHKDSPFKTLTVSIGGAIFKSQKANLLKLVDETDKNLYRAKEQGRNRIIIEDDN